MVHTGAHAANVINFSFNYNTEWAEVNMADYRGQNPLEIVMKTGETFNFHDHAF